MHAISQIIERNLHRQTELASALWINPGKDEGWRNANEKCAALKLSSQDFGTYDHLRKMGADVGFSAFPELADGKYDWIILNLPRQKAALRMLLDCAASLLNKNGVLWLAGENKAGIKSADKVLKSRFERVRKLDNARHCTLYEADTPLLTSPFDPRTYREKWILENHSAGVRVVSYPGVFAHGRLDTGTALLLDTLGDLKIQGSMLDFACGAGLIGSLVARLYPETDVTFLDSNAMALLACSETLAANGLTGTILASDGLSMLEGEFDWIISNPPIHENVKTNNQFGMQLMDSIQQHLKPGGSLVLVSNIHLPYEKWLTQRFGHCVELSSNKHFKVISGKFRG